MSYYEAVYPTMPWGKHKGIMVDRLPESYLRWMSKSMSDPFLRTCAAAVIAGKPCPEPEDCVFLDVADSGAIILIDAPYELKEDIKMLSERGWDAERKKWWVPIHGFEELMDEFPAAHPSAALKKMIGVSAERQDLLEAINLDTGEGDTVDMGDGLKLYPYQATAVRFLDATDARCLIADEMGCITGDAMISLNRGGKSFKMRLEQLYQRFNSRDTTYHSWDKSIPTMARSLVPNGTFRLNKVLKVIDKGRRPVLQITTLSGKVLKLTPDHELLCLCGWVPASDIAIGDVLFTNGTPVCKRCGSDKNLITYKYAKYRGYCKECMYRQLRDNRLAYNRTIHQKDGSLYISGGLKYHPNNTTGGIPEHRLIMEAKENGFTLDGWLAKIRVNDLIGCTFLSMDMEVHHINGDASDNRIENLQTVTVSEHSRIDDRYKHIADVFIPKEDVIVSIESVEPQRVYDIVMDDPGRNFIANGIIVHNCGKTIEALAWLRAHPENRPVLIVCPATMRGTWAKEVAKWLGDTNPIILKSKDTYAFDPTRNVVIINYDIMDAWKESLLHHRYNTMIIDESHYIKSNKAKRSKAVVALAHKSKHRILLTGTPVVNKPIDLFNQLNAIDPVAWGSYFNFGKRYCGAHQEWISDEKQVWMFDGATNLDELSERLKSTIMLRRTKEQVLPELPDKTRSVIDVEIDNWKAYTKLIDNMDGSNQPPIAIFTELLMTMMRGKIKPSIRYIDDVLSDVDKLVVFCTHTEMINALETKFADRGVVKIDGSVPVQKRTDIIEQFQTDPDTQLFLGNVQAAGMGITLTAASHSIFTELPWGPTILEQAEDRLHRLTQENAVNIYILNAVNTIDAHITDLIVHKKQIINMINDDMTFDTLKEFIGR
jgi:SWI/SNF-related matrix-associated actin-dependent regulator 1 of chromatin subfamily A